MPTAFLTGARGFTGHYMHNKLQAQGVTVYSFDGDITERERIQTAVTQVNPDWVIHLAAVSFVGHAKADAFYQVNVMGTLNLLESLASLPKKPERILIASSANIYGTPQKKTISEDTCPAPVNHYGCSKLAMEHMVSNWFDDLPIITTRPFNYTGPGQALQFLIPKIVSHYARKDPLIELGNLDISRNFSDVRDVVDCYWALLNSNARSVKVNICSNKATSLHEIIQFMNKLSGYTMDVRTNPAFVRANEIRVLQGNNHLLHSLIGHVPTIPLEKTLTDMYQELAYL